MTMHAEIRSAGVSACNGAAFRCALHRLGGRHPPSSAGRCRALLDAHSKDEPGTASSDAPQPSKPPKKAAQLSAV